MRGQASSISQPKKKFLRSKRLDISQYDTPELSWSFYDSYNKSSQSMVAIEHGENSVQGYNLDKYLSLTKSFTKIPTLTDVIEHLPAPFNELVVLQDDSGQFENLPAVLKILALPKDLRISRAESDVQSATAFAVAAIRQRIDLFDRLQNVHDLAVKWVHHGLVLDARDLIADYTLSPDEIAIEYPRPKVPQLQESIAMNSTSMSASEKVAISEEAFQRSMQTTRKPDLTVHQDICIGKIQEAELAITELMLKLDGLIVGVTECLKQCVHKFLSTELLAEKNAAFDELSSRLGDGVPPRDGYLDWRKDGVPGVRPVIVKILCTVHMLSELRMDLEEYRTDAPSLSVMHLDNTRYFSNDNRGRFAFHYNGGDVSHKLLHCLDFLRSCRELSSWYGRKYWFCGNPLQLPFNYSVGFAALNMSEKVRAKLKSKPHQRITATQSSVVSENHGDELDWNDHQFYSTWSLRFMSFCDSTWQWNWPAIPDVKKVEGAQQIHTALLVLYCSAAEEIDKTVAEETEFMNTVKAGRGEHLMVGKSGMKPNRKVQLPPDSIILRGVEDVMKGADPSLAAVRRKPLTMKSKSVPRRLAALT